MKIARPANGFHIRVLEPVQAFVDQTCADFADFKWRWESVLARLAATGHVDGVAVDGSGSQRAGTFTLAEWRIRVAWRVVGDGLTIVRAEF